MSAINRKSVFNGRLILIVFRKCEHGLRKRKLPAQLNWMHLKKEAKSEVRKIKRAAWEAFLEPLKQERDLASASIRAVGNDSLADELDKNPEPIRKEIDAALHEAIRSSINHSSAERDALIALKKQYNADNSDRYSSHLYSPI